MNNDNINMANANNNNTNLDNTTYDENVSSIHEFDFSLICEYFSSISRQDYYGYVFYVVRRSWCEMMLSAIV